MKGPLRVEECLRPCRYSNVRVVRLSAKHAKLTRKRPRMVLWFSITAFFALIRA